MPAGNNLNSSIVTPTNISTVIESNLIRFGTTEQGRDDKFMKLDMHDNEN